MIWKEDAGGRSQIAGIRRVRIHQHSGVGHNAAGGYGAAAQKDPRDRGVPLYNGVLQPDGEALLHRQRTSDAHHLRPHPARAGGIEHADLYFAQRVVPARNLRRLP